MIELNTIQGSKVKEIIGSYSTDTHFERFSLWWFGGTRIHMSRFLVFLFVL
jgi:hypothetical protein